MNKIGIYNTIISLLNDLQEMILLFRMQNFNRADRMFSKWTGTYGQAISDLFAGKEELNAATENGLILIDEGVILSELQGLMNAMEQKDYVLMSDLMQLQILPFLEAVQNELRELILREAEEMAAGEEADMDALLKVAGASCEDNGRTYSLEPTSSGELTLSITDENGSYYMHSNVCPTAEAQLFAKQYYDDHAPAYAVCGLGLGYHVLALCRETHGLVDVTVYESDQNIIDLARQVHDFSYYEERNLKIVHDPTLLSFAGAILSDAQPENALPVPVIHYPSIRNVVDPGIRDRLMQLFVQDSSIRNQLGEMLANFRYNAEHATASVDALADTFRGRDVILVAAGPSLDRNVELLRPYAKTGGNAAGGPLIVCVGTAFRKLLGMGIRPDFVGFLDASERIRAQIRGVENETIPILLGSTATKSITRGYAGEKYLICQQGFTEAETFAKEHGGRTYETGGSVATILFDVAKQLGAKRIVTVGLDLAYTGMQIHAKGAGNSRILADTQGLVEVASQNGEKLYTTAAMQMYIQWFERYMSAHAGEGTEFIDATEGGAKIQGMRIAKLNEILC
ncbi:MAG: motility associated factor glycosyltransferase family protein [Lachnospiraceae bacterium]|nr:motility associated factor glycosyltransferase family protein [Lachnospiraceae bacterium]